MQTISLTYVLEKYLNLNISNGEHWSVRNFPSPDIFVAKTSRNDFFTMTETIFVTVSSCNCVAVAKLNLEESLKLPQISHF